MRINGLEFKPATSRGDGNNRMTYMLVDYRHKTRNVKYPRLKTLQNLARDHLHCELEEHSLRRMSCVYFLTIDGGVKKERRNAFLAAVITRSTFTEV